MKSQQKKFQRSKKELEQQFSMISSLFNRRTDDSALIQITWGCSRRQVLSIEIAKSGSWKEKMCVVARMDCISFPVQRWPKVYHLHKNEISGIHSLMNKWYFEVFRYFLSQWYFLMKYLQYIYRHIMSTLGSACVIES